jgi:hypothetical protein
MSLTKMTVAAARRSSHQAWRPLLARHFSTTEDADFAERVKNMEAWMKSDRFNTLRAHTVQKM